MCSPIQWGGSRLWCRWPRLSPWESRERRLPCSGSRTTLRAGLRMCSGEYARGDLRCKCLPLQTTRSKPTSTIRLWISDRRGVAPSPSHRQLWECLSLPGATFSWEENNAQNYPLGYPCVIYPVISLGQSYRFKSDYRTLWIQNHRFNSIKNTHTQKLNLWFYIHTVKYPT